MYQHSFVTYTGDGTASQAITGAGFQPDIVLVKVRSNDVGRGGGCLKTVDIGTNNSLPIPGAALITNGILSLDADGFTVGAATRVNDNLVAYVALCLQVDTEYCRTGTYTGDGNDDRSITIAAGFQPDFMLIFGTTNQTVYRSRSHVGDSSSVIANDTSASNLIQAFEANGFQVGSNASVNNSGTVYFYLAWRRATTDLDSMVMSGSYVGNGAAPQGVTGVGFQPAFVVVAHDEAGIDGGWKHSSQAGTEGSAWSASGTSAFWVRGLDADGFTVGINLDTNLLTYHYLALTAAGGVDLYTGDGGSLTIAGSSTSSVRNPTGPAGSLSPYPRLQLFDDNGAVLASGEVNMYEAGTATPLTPYTDEALATPHASPIVLDSAGRATVYLDEERYKGILEISDGRTVWSVDPIPATRLLAVQGGKRVPIGGSSELGIFETRYASGAGAENLIPGTKILQIDSDRLVGTWKLRGMLKIDGGEITVGLMNLSDGAPDTALVELSSVSTIGEQVTSPTTITFAAGGSVKSYGVKAQRTAALSQLTSAEYGTLAFTAPDLIVRTVGSWITDGYNVTGWVIEIAGATEAANNGSFTVASATATTLTIVEQTLVTEGASIAETVDGPFGVALAWALELVREG